jgi:hypothetical protein
MNDRVQEEPRDRARRRLLRMGAYAPAALVSLVAVSQSAERASATTKVGTIVNTKVDVTVKAFSTVKAKSGG